MLAINNLRKTYRNATEPSLDGLTLCFNNTTIAGLLGPNGAGKTTTISILCGMVRADEGEASLLGLPVGSANEAIKSRIGVVPQSIALYPTLTAVENLQYIGRLYGLKSTDIMRKIKHYLSLFGLDKSADKAIRHYSGGMKRRANIIASLLHEPELLILDEPTAGVDVQSRNLIIEFLLSYHNQGHAVLYTSHLMEEAQQLCKEVAIIDNGKLLVQGTTSQLLAEAGTTSLEQAFLQLTGTTLRD